jgi:hypothetical protein
MQTVTSAAICAGTVWVALVALPADGQATADGRWHARVEAIGVLSPHELSTAMRGLLRTSIGRGVGAGAALGWAATQNLRLVLEAGFAQHPDFSSQFCSNNNFGGCVLQPAEEDPARSYQFGVGVEFSLPAQRGPRFFVEAGMNAAGHTHTLFSRRRTELRRAWHGGAGLRVALAPRRALRFGLRGVSMSNPPWGHEALTDVQLRVGFEFGL